MDQARGRSRRRHDGSHRVRRDALRQSTDLRGSRKRAPQSFPPPPPRRSQCTSFSSVPPPAGDSPSGIAGAPRAGWRAPIRGALSRAASRRPRSARDGARWFLLNASPDVHEQLRRLSVADTLAAVRHVPVEGIVLTDAELDHTLGLVLLREARQLQVAATDAVRRVLEDDSRLLPVTRAFAEVTVTELVPDRAARALLSRRHGERPPGRPASRCRPARRGSPARSSPATRWGSCFGTSGPAARAPSSPAAATSTTRCSRRLATADLVLFDGTFWTDDELIGARHRRPHRAGDGSPAGLGPRRQPARLAHAAGRQRVYTHINNTNPMLLEDSPERAQVEQAGLRVGVDGMRFTL